MDIKRLNNMMSDHGIYSRERLLIPVSKSEILINSTCYIELDTHAKREVAVLYLDGGPDNLRNLKGILEAGLWVLISDISLLIFLIFINR